MVPGPVILDLEGLSITEVECERLLNPYVGGVILFSRNIADYDAVVNLVAEIKAVRSDLLVCVDQEGGRVQRCKEGFTRLPPMQVFDQLYAGRPEIALRKARDTGWLLAAEILAAGMDFSFAPVLDIDDDFCSVIGDRSFSSDADAVTAISGAFIQGMHDAGMAVTGKHFPGHGGVLGDSHLELPVDTRTLDDLETKDLKPFNQLLPQLDALMPAHIVFPEVDDKNPVGFSSVWLQGFLRDKKQYNGVLFSDDLSMEGAAGAGSYAERAQAALSAGCDVVLVCNNPLGADEVLAYLARVSAPTTSARLPKMAPSKPSMSREILESTARWQQTSAWLKEQL